MAATKKIGEHLPTTVYVDNGRYEKRIHRKPRQTVANMNHKTLSTRNNDKTEKKTFFYSLNRHAEPGSSI